MTKSRQDRPPTEEGSEMNESDKTTNAAGQEPLGKSPVASPKEATRQDDPRGSTVRDVPASAAPSAVDVASLPLNWGHYPADAQEGWEMLCRAKARYDDLAKRLDSSQFDRDSLNVAYSTAEAALKRKDELLREVRQYLDIIGKPTMIITRCDAEALAKRIDVETGVKS